MPLGFNFISTVAHHSSPTPVALPSRDGLDKTLAEVIANYAPAFAHGASSYLSPFLCNGHLQTMYAGAYNFDGVDHIYYRREILAFADGGVASVDHAVHPLLLEKWDLIDDLEYAPPSQKFTLPPRTKYYSPEEMAALPSDDTKPMVIVLHGLSGGSHESYVRSFLASITQAPYNFEACVLNARGCANTSLTTGQLFCGVWTNDIRALVRKLRTDFPNRPLYAVGFSLGGSILANYLGQEGEACELTAASVVATPWDLSDSSIQIESSYIGYNLYSKSLSESLYKLLDKHYDMLSTNPIMENWGVTRFMAKTLRQFDDLFTSKFFGFNNAGEYYRMGSSINRIYKVRTPTLILNALDDPIAAATSYPFKEVTLNPYLLMASTSLGGHIGWFTPTFKRWYSEPLAQFFHGVNQEYVHGTPLKVTEDSLPIETKWSHDRLVV